MEKVDYVESPATASMHNLPRFGYPNTFAYMFGTQQQRSEYIYGLLFAGCFILAFFFVWTILLIVFKCLGPKKIGYLSGSPMKVSAGSKKPLIIRITFILASVSLVAFATTLVTEGLTQLKNGVGTVYRSSVELDQILTDVDAFLTTLDSVGDLAGPLRDELTSRLGNESFCPGIDLEAETGQDFDAIIQNATSLLDRLGNFTSPELEDTKTTVEDVQETNSNVQETSDNITPSSWQSLIFIVPFSVFAVLFLIGVALAWLGRAVQWYTCFLTWVVLPLFLVLVVICYLLAGGIAIAASANADFCAGGEDRTPEGSIVDILRLNDVTQETLTYQIVTFYIDQCTSTTDPLDFIREYEKDLELADQAVMEFEQAVQNVSVEQLAAICGAGDYSSLQVLADAVVKRLSDLVDAARNFLAAVSCENIVPLYTSTFYSGTCEYSVEGVTWTFASFLVIATMGLLMITFRTAYFPTQDANLEKQFESTPLAYQEEYEVEYDPSSALAYKDSAEDYGLEQQASGGSAGAVATGVAVGAAAGATAAAAMGSSSMNDDTVDTSGQASEGQQQDTEAGTGTSMFDDSSWLDHPPDPDDRISPQY